MRRANVVRRADGVCVARDVTAFVLVCVLALQPAVPLQAQSSGQPPSYFAITNAKIVTVSGATIEGGTVVIQNGLISAVGKDVKTPPGAWEIDGKGLTVYPGLIDAMSDIGLPTAPAAPAGGGAPGAAQIQAALQQAQGQRASQGPEDRPGTTPWRNAADDLTPGDRRLSQWRDAGFTSTLAMPRTGIFPGQGAVINLAGDRAGEMVVKAPAAVGITTQQPGGFTGFPGSLMGTISYIKQLFLDAAQAREAEMIYARNPRGTPRPEYDRATAVLNEALRAERPMLIPANNEEQILRMLALGDTINASQQNKARWILYGAQESYKPAAAAAIAAKKVPVLISLRWPERDRNGDPDAEDDLAVLRHRDKAPSAPAALEKAGVKFAFYSDGITTPRDILRNARKAIDAGLKSEAALRAFTLGAAEILGVAGQVGSVETGKIANLAVTDGDIFADRTRIRMVFVDGRKFEPQDAAAARPTEAPAGNMTGRWKITVTTPQGSQEGNADIAMAPDGTLTGTMTSQMGSSPISNGHLSGNHFSFSISLSMGGQAMTITYSGTLEGNTIKGTASLGPGAFDFTGMREGRPPSSADEAKGGAR